MAEPPATSRPGAGAWTCASTATSGRAPRISSPTLTLGPALTCGGTAGGGARARGLGPPAPGGNTAPRPPPPAALPARGRRTGLDEFCGGDHRAAFAHQCLREVV